MRRAAVTGLQGFAAVVLTVASNGPPVQVRDGTAVQVKLVQFISSETSVPGDGIRCEVAADVVVDGIVVIRRGTPATGRIVEASPARIAKWSWRWWRHRLQAGRLAFTIDETKSVDGQIIRLRSASTEPHERRIMTRVAPPILKWEHEGARFDVPVEGDYLVRDPP